MITVVTWIFSSFLPFRVVRSKASFFHLVVERWDSSLCLDTKRKSLTLFFFQSFPIHVLLDRLERATLVLLGSP